MEGNISPLAIKFFSWLKNGLFPVYCFSCGQEGKKICQKCADSIVFKTIESVCPFCHTVDSEGKTCQKCQIHTYLDGATSLGFYREPLLRGLIQAWKFNNDFSAAQVLFDLIKNKKLLFLLPPVDWSVTAIPLHKARGQERGFNQAEEIAKVVAREIQSEYFDLLERVEWTDPQARRSVDERQVGDLDGIFKTTSCVPPCVLICDDVLTSGATMDAAARALKEAGAQIVWGFTLVRADH